MPNTLPLPCRYPGCPRLGCTLHTEQRNDARPTANRRGYGAQWQRLRKMYLRRHPVCVDPDNNHPHQVRAATDVHHILAKVNGGTNEESNLQALCHSCHSKITAKETIERLNNSLGYAQYPNGVGSIKSL